MLRLLQKRLELQALSRPLLAPLRLLLAPLRLLLLNLLCKPLVLQHLSQPVLWLLQKLLELLAPLRLLPALQEQQQQREEALRRLRPEAAPASQVLVGPSRLQPWSVPRLPWCMRFLTAESALALVSLLSAKAAAGKHTDRFSTGAAHIAARRCV